MVQFWYSEGALPLAGSQGEPPVETNFWVQCTNCLSNLRVFSAFYALQFRGPIAGTGGASANDYEAVRTETNQRDNNEKLNHDPEHARKFNGVYSLLNAARVCTLWCT